MKQVKSCGGVVFRKGGKFLIIQNKEGKHWDFAKGRAEKGETEEETAKREIKEEVNIEVKIIDGFKEYIKYKIPYANVEKTVVIFLCEALKEDVKIQDEEISDYAWLEYEEAMKKLTHENPKNVLKKANEFLKKNI